MHSEHVTPHTNGSVLSLRDSRLFRVEMHILQNNDTSYSLVALSGEEAARSGLRTKTQGPYQVRELAVAARAAIAQALIRSGYQILNDEMPPQWRLIAQREIRQIRELRRHNTPDCSFDPKDVY